ncbi:Malate permease [Indibacter alkaliphilus LW1]|uniref:Malate permease n=1 Tax=Indibacter alkaliphilus (strain CCUG 57479 / KCTC 22604 / LW1) TaxID=1189612 RepID=S2D523_INDAL|nr:AEC family transporter [Indibacter alkaliphilus]EOZ92155.1 Malate permease [Indibacter alkaliphilus LW1]
MLNIILIVVFLVLGIFLQKVKAIPANLATYLNNYLIYVVLPVLALKYLPEVDLKLDLVLPIATAWMSFALSWAIFGFLGKKLEWKDSLTGCLIIVSGLANTSFVGFPIVRALYGEEAVKIALLIDQAGSFIIVSSIAVIVASIYSEGKKRKRDISKKILTFPPFSFFIIAMLMNVLDLEIPSAAIPVFEFIAATLTPVALVAVGLQVKVNLKAVGSPYLWLGLGYKLLLIPLVVYVLYTGIFRLDGLLLKVSVIETAMAPMITGSIIAISHDLEPKLASLLVGVGIPLSFLTLSVWYFVLA